MDQRRARSGAAVCRAAPACRHCRRLSELGDQPQMLALSGKRAGARAGLAGGRDLHARRCTHDRGAPARHRRQECGRSGAWTAPGRSRGPARTITGPGPGATTARRTTSFPSGHSAGALAVALAFSRESAPSIRAKALGGAGLIAAAQIAALRPLSDGCRRGPAHRLVLRSHRRGCRGLAGAGWRRCVADPLELKALARPGRQHARVPEDQC